MHGVTAAEVRARAMRGPAFALNDGGGLSTRDYLVAYFMKINPDKVEPLLAAAFPRYN